MSCSEFIRANVGTPYGRRSLEMVEDLGFQVCSDVDPRYGSVWLQRVCTAKSSEECAVLNNLGRFCETQTCMAVEESNV